MSLDARYIVATDLNPYLVDKDTGAPLAGGTIEFWQDDSRATPKTVYTLSGSPPNYSYVALPNPITLSSVGTIEDDNGANVGLYYFPFDSTDSDANLQLYYVVVKNSNGVIQFTREGWPNTTAESNPITNQNNTIVNLLSNPQFSSVLFDAANTLTITKSSASTHTISIAPDWTLEFTNTASANVQITRTPIAGTSQYPTNPPYTLTVVPSSNITSLKLYQRLSNNPSIWAPDTGGENGYVATNMVLANNSSVTVQYVPSTGTAQTLLDESNATGAYKEYSNTVQLDGPSNTSTADDGYVDIVLNLPPSSSSTFTSVQVVALDAEDTGITYEQTPVNRQEDQIFHYYNPLLQAKPVGSYLVGWDFPLNPAQFGGASVAAQAVGANKSYYAWDQTIIFQSANSAITTSRSTNGNLKLTAAVASTRAAIVQYLPQAEARQLLNHRLSAMVRGLSSSSAGLSATISLWYTTDANLPAMGSNNSLIATLGSDGKPDTFNGSWSEVSRSDLGDASFSITDSIQNFGFNGWDAVGSGGSATFFAIVVGFPTLSNSTPDFIEIESVSLVPGDIPSIPGAKSVSEVLKDCERYYEKSYAASTSPGATTGANALVRSQPTYLRCSSSFTDFSYSMGAGAFDIEFKSEKWSATPTVTLYSISTGGSGKVDVTLFYNTSSAGDAEKTLSTFWSVYNLNKKRTSYISKSTNLSLAGSTSGTSLPPAGWVKFHYVADSRLGVV